MNEPHLSCKECSGKEETGNVQPNDKGLPGTAIQGDLCHRAGRVGACGARRVVYKGWGYTGATNQKGTKSQAPVVPSEKMRQARTAGRVSYSRVSKRAESAVRKVKGSGRLEEGPGGGGLMEEETGHKGELLSASGHQIRTTGLCPGGMSGRKAAEESLQKNEQDLWGLWDRRRRKRGFPQRCLITAHQMEPTQMLQRGGGCQGN